MSGGKGTTENWPELDALRFFAFLGVFIFHVIPHDSTFYSQHQLFPQMLVWPICVVVGPGPSGSTYFCA